MTTLRKLPLHRWHEAQGATTFEPLGAYRMPASYADPEREERALQSGLALFDRSAFSRLEILGEDRVRFLNGLLTCDVESLSAGSGVYGYFTAPKAGVLADVVIYALEDRFWLDLPPNLETVIREHLEKYIVADRVEVVALDEMIPLALMGPDLDPTLATGVLSGAEGKSGLVRLVEAWSHSRATLWGSEVHLTRHERLGRPGLVVWVSASIADLFADDLLSEVTAQDGSAIVPLGLRAFEDQRIRAGIGLYGVDFDQQTLPQELGDELGINFDKGCYLGQEVVARLHYRGQVPRQLRRLVFDDLETGKAEAGLDVLFEDRSAGKLTSITARAPYVGLARLARRAFEVGTKVVVEDLGPATVEDVAG